MSKTFDNVLPRKTHIEEETLIGRPREDLTSLPLNWYDEVLDMYKEGASDVEVKALIYEWRGSFSNDLWERWIADEEQFSETIKMGKLMSESWWQKQGRTNLKNKRLQFHWLVHEYEE